MLNFESFEKCEPGYYLGNMELLPGMLFHVELIEVDRLRTEAKNRSFQSRIDNWFSKNDDEHPQLFYHKKKRYFVHVEAFAR